MNGGNTISHRMVVQKSSELSREWAGEKRTMPPQWWLDREAERKMSGGFDLRKSNLCGSCFEYRSTNGSCGCD